MRNPLYIDLMEKVLLAYSDEHIERYCNDVKKGGLKEHGFPRLTANIGILIAHGRRCDLKEQLVRMMDLCCEEIPKHKKAANEFSIKEIIFSLLELEKNQIFPQEQIERWKNSLKAVIVENCYNEYAEKEDSFIFNWAAFAMLSEWMRYQIGAAEEDMDFIDIQAASQWQWVDENGMYRDPNEPMVYDFVTRGLFSLLFYLGYRGKYFDRWDDALKRAGLLSLKMISACGEMPYGGRSNQFIHNEAHCAVIMEYEAVRYAALGDTELAGKFKAFAKRALENIESNLAERPINHVKNRFPRETGYGCEFYAYFDKYMITAASFLYVAYMFSDETIRCGNIDDLPAESWQSSDHFHKLFLRSGEYFAEYDYRADYHYDASGLGRLHRKGAPPTICLSTPGTDTPGYEINSDDAAPFAIAPEFFCSGKWISGAERTVSHKIENHGAQGESAFAKISCSGEDTGEFETLYTLDSNGLHIEVSGSGRVGLLLPVFEFDGCKKTVITNSPQSILVKYNGWICRYTIRQGTICDTGKRGCNRNGHYKLFRAENDRTLNADIEICPDPQK